MKMKNIFCMVLLMVVSQSVMALGVKIQNNSQSFVQVDPVWSGNKRGWMTLKGMDALNNNQYKRDFDYKTGPHGLKGLFVRYGKNDCYYHDFEKAGLRGTGDIVIFIEEQGKISLAGSTDMLFTDVSRVWMNPVRYNGYSVTKMSCD